ncbi:amidohydrolase family protein [Brachybacterium halotolerans subsp. kimchii]|uniref:Amidohydrolase family protein n=1 Tax=Brachybacterium halotolerans TaxID=2795215 RepID=A0ABS1BDJ0_9MICO|nr:amidohydrolase family protein [Brachybacterium halotolerans]MBK0332717.1 amidohydrolase family protein [Brachybacterium halotolerans]UEJ83747.1 amidohydrolase family protein [Brachybacterium halotolerans subsp. kimchii]
MRTDAPSVRAARESFAEGRRPAADGPAYDRAEATASPVLHLTGPILLGPEEELAEAWVAGGRIHHEKPDLPAGTGIERIDGFVLPGLADLHCHVGISDEGTATGLEGARAQARIDRDTGVLLIRDAGSITDTAPLQREADLPRIVRAGRHVARTRRYLIGYAHEVDPEDLPATVAAEAERGDGWVKLVGDWIDRQVGDLTPTWSADDFRAAAEAAHAHGARITTHTFDEETLPLVLDAGFDCLEHATGLTGDTIARAAEAGVPVVTTLVNVDEFETYASQGERKFPDYAAHMRRLRARRFERTRDAHDAGVQLLTGTDAGGVLGHGIIHDELDELAACGLDPLAILQAASWGPRAFLGAPGLEDGAPADLLVACEDPRRDHRALRDPAHIVLGGAVIR